MVAEPALQAPGPDGAAVAPIALRHPRRGAPPALIRALSVVCFLAVWQVAGTLSDSLSIPTLTETARAWWVLMSTGELPVAMGLSMMAMVLGFAAAAAGGVAIGLTMGWYEQMEEALDIYLSLLLVLPMMALVPVIISVFGLTIAARVAVVFLFAVVNIVINTAAGVRQVDPALVEMACSFGASSRQVFFRILLPGAMPAIVAGLRLGIGRAFVGMVSAEMLVTAAGFGNLILEYSAKFKPEFVFATLITVITVAILTVQGMRRVERRLLAWMHTRSG